MDTQNTPNAPQTNDALQVGAAIPQGASIGTPTNTGLQVGAPIPQGASIGNPTEPQPSPNNLGSMIDKITDTSDITPGWAPNALEKGIMDTARGGMKSAAQGLGGLLDLIHGKDQKPDQMKTLASLYKRANPGATDEQVAAYLNNITKNQAKMPPDLLKEAADWLHTAGQPKGFWEHIGALGEQAVELLGTDGMSKLASVPVKEAKLGEAGTAVADTVAHAQQTGMVAKFLKDNPKIAGLVSIGLKSAKDALLVGGQNYLHNEDTGEAVKTGLLGGGLAAPFHALGELAGSAANAVDELAPKKVEVPTSAEGQQGEPFAKGSEIPVAATHPQLPEPKTAAGKIIQGAASKEGAKKFVAENVQPAATKAVQDNFQGAAHNAVDELNMVQQGDEFVPQRPKLNTVDEASKFMKDEARKTYQKLDDAAQPEVDEWEAQYGKKAAQKPETVSILGPDGKPVVTTTTGEEIPEKPKLFTELQDQIRNAKATISSKLSSQVDKQDAIDNLPQYEQEMKDFLAKHGDVVNDGELDAANTTYSKGLQYEWVADKIRSAAKGAEAGSTFKGDLPSLNPRQLEALPRAFDTKFGEGAFLELMGPKGVKNFNDIVNTLKTPTTGNMFFEWLKQLPFNVGKIGTVPASATADRILFDPVVGQKVLNAFRTFEAGAHAVAKGPGVAASNAGVMNKNSSLKDAFNSAQSQLSK